MKWSPEAEAFVRRAPFFVRGLARKQAEALAISLGCAVVTVEVVEQARQAAAGDGNESLPASSEAELDPKAVEALVEQAADAPEYRTRHYEIRVCGGAVGCPFTLIDVQAQADALRDLIEASGWCEALEERTQGRPLLAHHKFRAAVAGCPNACSEPQTRDFGVIGQVRPAQSHEPCIECGECVAVCREGAITLEDGEPRIDDNLCMKCELCVRACPTGTLLSEEAGYKVTVGGKLGRHPHLADTLLAYTDQEGVAAAAREVLALMMEKDERLTDMIAIVGLDKVRQRVEQRKESVNSTCKTT
jgi:dissimilatory sulfite reductase (desulfoviridin) alpha/beta subunit